MATVATEPQNVTDRARLVLKDMSQWRIAPSPENYHVWFLHLSGANPHLTHEIERLLNAGESITTDSMSRLYAEFVANEKESEMLRNAQHETQLLLRGVLEEVIGAHTATSDYNTSLDSYAHDLARAHTLKDVQEIVVGLLMSTADITKSTSDLQKRLEETTAQTESLQEQLHQAIEDSTRDALTGLQNRQAADELLHRLFNQYSETGETFSFLLLDIDNFKLFNDTYGHLVGDAVLQKVAVELRENLKGRDLPARYGGEEFVAILPSTSLQAARTVADQLRKAIEAQRLKIAETKQSIGSITASFGVAMVQAGDTIASLVGRADKALYLAKDSGRNNVKTESDL